MKNHTKICSLWHFIQIFGSKPSRIRFDEVDGFIRIYDGIQYLMLLGPEKYDAIYSRIRYLISQKSGITYIFSHNYRKINIDSYDPSPPEKTLCNVIFLIKSVLNKDKNHYCNIFLEKCSYK